jgi:hypothetical protein
MDTGGIFRSRRRAAVIIPEVIPPAGGELSGTVNTIKFVAFTPQEAALNVAATNIFNIPTSAAHTGDQGSFTFVDFRDSR